MNFSQETFNGCSAAINIIPLFAKFRRYDCS
jgi:hypothetical protein